MSTATSLDVRTIPPRDRHPTIFGRFDALKPGEAFHLVNDHDPVPLRMQFENRAPGQFSWTYLQSGPELWQVEIRRTAGTGPAADSCCSGGACGGG